MGGVDGRVDGGMWVDGEVDGWEGGWVGVQMMDSILFFGHFYNSDNFFFPRS